MSWLKGFASIFTGSFMRDANEIVKTVAGDASQREGNTSSEQKAVLETFAKEFAERANRTWWDSFVDGLNRLPRPLTVFAVFGLFVYAGVDPAGFTIFMTALSVIPEWLTYVIGQIIMLYFGGRMITDWKIGKAASPEAVRAVMSQIAELKKIQAGADGPPQAQIVVVPGPTVATHPDSMTFEEQMTDESAALSNSSIAEWNARRKKG